MSLYRPAGPKVQAARQVVYTIAKRDYVRSPALREIMRGIPCQHCGADDGTVCAAHSNWAIHGKGKSIKADDNYAASLCAKCHTLLDQGLLFDHERKRMWWTAFDKTVDLLVALNRWPAKVPMPSLICPWPGFPP